MARPSPRISLALLSACLFASSAWADPEPSPSDAAPPAAPAPAATPTPPAPPPAPALPMAPEFTCEGSSGATRHLRNYLGRAVVIVYEDRDSNHQNDVLKRELEDRVRAQGLASAVSVVPVANLSGFNFWPAMGYARDAVVDIARQQRTEVLIDWSGNMARAYRFRPGVSYVMVLSREGRVMFRHAGTLQASARSRFFNALTNAIAAP
ncbi:MAG: hypothetical protein R3A48_14205 [Polyangiales bacterium]